jgi:hypothetical protein
MIRALAIGAAAALTLAPAAADAKRKPLRCKGLHGKIEIGNKAIKVVRSKDRDGFAVLRGCAKPNGVVRELGREEDEGLGGSSVGAVRAIGTWVLIDYSGSNQYASSQAAWLSDAATGRRNHVYSGVRYMGDPGYDHYLDALYWDAQGRAVTVIGTPTAYANSEPTDFTEAVAVHAPDSTKVTVDSGTRAEIPPSSLTYADGTASWTHGGEPRSVTFG